MKKSTKAKAIKGAEIGGAITAAVLAAAAGAYLLSDKKNQKKMKSWVKAAQKEVAKKAKVAKKLGEAQYKAIVDETVRRYGSLEDVTAKDVIEAGKELKAQWTAIRQQAKAFSKPAPARKPAKKKATVSRKSAHRAKKTQK